MARQVGKGWHKQHERHSNAAQRGWKNRRKHEPKRKLRLNIDRVDRAEGYKAKLARDLYEDGFAPSVSSAFRTLEKNETVLKAKWDKSESFRRSLSYSGGLGIGAKDGRAAAIKRIAAGRWADLSDSAKTMLLIEYAYGEEEFF